MKYSRWRMWVNGQEDGCLFHCLVYNDRDQFDLLKKKKTIPLLFTCLLSSDLVFLLPTYTRTTWRYTVRRDGTCIIPNIYIIPWRRLLAMANTYLFISALLFFPHFFSVPLRSCRNPCICGRPRQISRSISCHNKRSGGAFMRQSAALIRPRLPALCRGLSPHHYAQPLASYWEAYSGLSKYRG